MRILLCVLSLFVMLGCRNADQKESLALENSPAEFADEVAPALNQPEPEPERKLIRNGSMSFEVEDVTATRQMISQLAKDLGGYIASEKMNRNESSPRHEQVVRIPGNRFDEFIAGVEGLARAVDDEDFSSEDVTEAFVDLESRLIAKKELEGRFREIVRQAKTIKDILEVEAEIGIVRNEIEQIEGKLKYLSNKTTYSTITLTYYQPTPPIEVPGTGTKFVDSFIDGWNGFVGFLIGLTRTWPFLLVIGLAAWLIIRRSKKGTVITQ